MKNIYFTPGPSQIYPTLKLHMTKAFQSNIPSVSHRGQEFMNIFDETSTNLSKLLGIPKTHKIYFVSSATECMERTILSCVEKSSHHFVNGTFSGLFYSVAVDFKKIPTISKSPLGEGFEFRNENIPPNSEAVCFTHNESSTGVWWDLSTIKKTNKKQIYCLDIVSSTPYVKVDFDLFDIVFFSVQKGFGLPAGLGVLVVSPLAYKKAEKILSNKTSIKSYHDFSSLEKFRLVNQTPATPNVMDIYLLGKVAGDMLKYGIRNIRRETDLKAKMIYDYYSESKYLSTFVQQDKNRSKTICVAKSKISPVKIIEKLKEYGMVIGSGYGEMKLTHIRISNFPAHSVSDIKKLIKKLKLVEERVK